MVGTIDRVRRGSSATRTPRRLLLAAVAPAVCVLGFSVMLTVIVGGVRDGYRSVGADSNAAVSAAGELTYDLADMDGKAAEILLVGDGSGLPQDRDSLYQAYENDEADANARLTGLGPGLDGVPGAATAFAAVENGLDQYSADVARAFYLDWLDHGQPLARPPSAALAQYQTATAAMHEAGTGLLAEANALFRDEQFAAGEGYQGRLDVLGAVSVAGVALTLLVVAVLILVQVRLARKFHRVLNPLIALSTVFTLVFGVLLFSALGQARDSYAAERAGQTTTYWQDAADGADMKASDTRWLLDLAGTTVSSGTGISAERAQFGTDQIEVGSSGPAFATYLADDRHLTAVAGDGTNATELSAAATFDIGQTDQDFAKYVSEVNRSIVSASGLAAAAGARGSGGLLPWLWLPSGWALVMFALILGGVRPRLREYHGD